MFWTYFMAVCLTAVAVGTYAWQRSAFNGQLQLQDIAPFEADFYRRRHLRRARISLLLGLVAVAMMIGCLLVEPLVVAIFGWAYYAC